MDESIPLLILGAGPKGTALWTKHTVLKGLGLIVPPLVIFEKKQIGSYWRGDDGFTDGMQFLVTPSEQDLGYPYALEHPNRQTAIKIRDAMLQYSWMQYLLSKNAYCKWVLTERPRAPHYEFVDYLSWAANRSGLKRTESGISEFSVKDGNWWLRQESKSELVEGIGLVITGSGEPRRLEDQPTIHPRLLDGRTFWKNLTEFENLTYARVAVIGAGETAAAIAAAALEKIEDVDTCSIDLICKQNAYFTRGQIQKDLRFFSDPTGWNKLSEGRRLSIIRRADRGVVSAMIKDKLEDSTVVEYTNADVLAIKDSGATKLTLKLQYEDGDIDEIPYDFVIVATGFNPLWFIELFESGVQNNFFEHLFHEMSEERKKHLAKVLGTTTSDRNVVASWITNRNKKNVSKITERVVSDLIDSDLSLRGFVPRLHLPMLAGLAQGPGFPNLNCLGLISDRIFAHYMKL